MAAVVEPLIPAPDPAWCCERLAGLPCRLLLDSALHGPLGRYSFLTADPVGLIRSKGAHGAYLDRVSDYTARISGDALAFASALVGRHAVDADPALPPFQGGLAGYVGYDWGRTLERLPAARHDDLGLPDLTLGLYDWVLAWDHAARSAWLISTGLPETGSARLTRARERAAAIRSLLDGSRDPAESPPIERLPSATPRGAAASHAVDDPRWDPRVQLRSSFSAFLDLPDAVVLSASPERFLRIDPGGHVETRPIKGTRPRGLGPEHDAALGAALAESEKDRAENLMIVDLMRNDLSRVCEPGSVRVSELYALERYATVHHLVSTVVGRLAPGIGPLDALRAAFPGGSVTGAPKLRAMEVIAELEPSERGVYCGALGYLSVTGALDTSIAIRTAVAQSGRIYFNAGGGVVADSDPEQEYRETLDKACGIIDRLAPGR